MLVPFFSISVTEDGGSFSSEGAVASARVDGVL